MTGLPFWEMPDRLVIGEKTLPINTDFRVGIRIRQLFSHPAYTASPARLFEGIDRLLFGGRLGAVGDEAWDALLCTVV